MQVSYVFIKIFKTPKHHRKNSQKNKTKQNSQNKLRFLTTYNVYYIKKTKIPIMWNKMKMHIVSGGVNLYNHYGDQD